MRLLRRRTAKTRDEVEREMRSLGWWYQHFALPNGIWTGDGKPPAYDPRDRWNAFEPYIPADLSGKTALDVGGNSGFFAIQMMLRGAKRVVLVEPFKEFTDQARFAAEQFDVKLDVVNADVHTYCLTTEERFDYVLFLGLFYHLKYPVLVLDRLAEMTRERLVLQSHSVGPADGEEIPGLPEAENALDDPDYPKLALVEHRYKNDPADEVDERDVARVGGVEVTRDVEKTNWSSVPPKSAWYTISKRSSSRPMISSERTDSDGVDAMDLLCRRALHLGLHVAVPGSSGAPQGAPRGACS